MQDGFLGFNASFMLDTVVCALVAVVPVICFSLLQVKRHRNYELHRKLQMTLALVLLLAVGAFEIDLQVVHGGWQNVVAKRDPPLDPTEYGFVRKVLWIHLVFAVTTPLLWATTIGLALSRFNRPAGPSDHSRLHSWLGWMSTIDLILTSATGLVFYYFAFIAEY